MGEIVHLIQEMAITFKCEDLLLLGQFIEYTDEDRSLVYPMRFEADRSGTIPRHQISVKNSDIMPLRNCENSLPDDIISGQYRKGARMVRSIDRNSPIVDFVLLCDEIDPTKIPPLKDFIVGDPNAAVWVRSPGCRDEQVDYRYIASPSMLADRIELPVGASTLKQWDFIMFR